MSLSARKATRDMNPQASLKDSNFSVLEILVSVELGFHFVNWVRISARSAGLRRVVFEVDMRRPT